MGVSLYRKHQPYRGGQAYRGKIGAGTSLIGTNIARGLLALSTLAGQTTVSDSGATGQVMFRVSPTGTWASLPAGSLLQPGPPMPVGYDERGNSILQPTTAILRVPFGGPFLRTGPNGAQVMDAMGLVWGAMGVEHSFSLSRYDMRRSPQVQGGRDLGQV